MRPSWDFKSSVAVVSISIRTTATTQAPTTNVPTESTPSDGGDCDDTNKELYFILMIVFASLLGLALLVLICTPIILKLCR